MIFKMKNKIITILIFSIYIIFTAADICGFSNKISSVLRFLTVLLSFVFAIINDNKTNGLRKFHCLFLTCFCDIILLFTNKYFIGVFIFSLVHLGYINITLNKIYLDKFVITKEISKLVLLIYIYLIMLNIQSLYSICTLYALMFLLNILYALKALIIYKDRENFLFVLALFMFVLCDIFTAIYNITYKDYFITILWLFYTPSQYFIALSSKS